MRTRDIGLAVAALAFTFSTTACGSSASTPAKPAAAAVPTTSRSAGPFTAAQLKVALLDPASWGTGWTDVRGGPTVLSAGLGEVGQIPSQDCWTAIYRGAGTGSLTAVDDVVSDHSSGGDIADQAAYQYGPGGAARMVSEIAAKVDRCSSFTHADNSGTYTLQAHEEPVPALGDQAIKITVRIDGPQSKDVQVDLDARYGDVVIAVGYDSGIPGQALAYDLAGKVKAIAAKLGPAAGG